MTAFARVLVAGALATAGALSSSGPFAQADTPEQSAPIEQSTPLVVEQDEPGRLEDAPPASSRSRGEDRRLQSSEAGPRRTLLPLVQPLWSELSPAQQQVLEPFAEQWNSWSTSDKRNWLALAERLPRMQTEDQLRTRERIAEWAALTPEQRRVARQNYRIARELPPEERRTQWERYQRLSPEEQKALRSSGPASNTAARTANPRSGLAREAAQPLVPGSRDKP